MELIPMLRRLKVLPIIRVADAGIAFPLVQALHQGGMDVVEVTLTVPDALQVIEQVRCTLPTLTIGAGTVRNRSDATQAIDAGSQFLVTYKSSEEVAEVGRMTDIPFILGGATPTEIDRCLELGSDVVKLFPASSVGPRYIEAIKGPLPSVELLPTGGILEEDIPKWLSAGAIAVGIGGGLLNVGRGKNANYEEVAQRASRLKYSLNYHL